VTKKLPAAAGVVVLLMALLGLLLGCGGGGGAKLPSDAMAQVGTVTITQSQYDKKLAELEKQLGSQVPNKQTQAAEYKIFQQQVLDYMVTLEIAKQKQASLKVSVTDAQIQAQIDQIKAMFGGDEAQFAAALKQQNLTLEELKVNLQEQMLVQGLITAVTVDATVPAAAAQAYYDAHKEEFKVPEARLTRHILFAPKTTDASTTPTDAQWAEAKARADKIRKDIMSGSDFSQMAKENSDDAGTKDLGGDLGEVQKGAMVPAFEEATFALEEGEISQPVKTEFGYHLIQVQTITAAKTQTFAEVKDVIDAQLLDEAMQKMWEAWVVKMKKELNVIYRDGWAPATTTTTAQPAAGTEETTAPEGTTTTAK
jgi:parvulin-like peptidyl-prolyl isomerase